jgi:CHRD domain-containing protein
MKSHLRIIVSVLFVLLVMAGTALAAANRNFTTHLAGRYEVPVRDTQGQGEAIFQLTKDGTELHYKLNVANIENVWMAHIHLGPPGVAGPIVVWLYPRMPPPPAQSLPGRTDGTLAEGEITAADFVGPLAGQPFSALIDAIEAGNTYVNVHTNDFIDPANTGPGDFPGGEIRGQLDTH